MTKQVIREGLNLGHVFRLRTSSFHLHLTCYIRRLLAESTPTGAEQKLGRLRLSLHSCHLCSISSKIA